MLCGAPSEPQSMKSFNTNTANCETWLTPPALIKALGAFDLDPCCPATMPWHTACRMLSQERDGDGLSAAWSGRVWLNPPYGRKTFVWLAKLAEHKSGIALIFARTDTRGFHDVVFRQARCIFFLAGRVRFHRADGTLGQAPNAASCLVSYSYADTLSIFKAAERGDIKGAPCFPQYSCTFYPGRKTKISIDD